MVASHLTGRKNSKSVTFIELHQRSLDAACTAAKFRVILKRIYREEDIFKIRDETKDEICHDFEVGTNLRDGVVENDTLDGTERMVANKHERTFFRDAVQLVFVDIISGVITLQHIHCKLLVFQVGRRRIQAVNLTESNNIQRQSH